MKRPDERVGIATLNMGLLEYTNADTLKQLVALTGQSVPTRKAELATAMERHLSGESLHAAWERLDALQRSAVAEAIYDSPPALDVDRFVAKYGHEPDWGKVDRYGRVTAPSVLGWFLYGGRFVPGDLATALKAFVPTPAPPTITSLAELPELWARTHRGFNRDSRRFETETLPPDTPLKVDETERVAQKELLTLLRLIDAGKISVSDKTLRPSQASVATVGAILEHGDFYPVLPVTHRHLDENAGPIRAFAWPMIVQAGGLAARVGAKLQLTDAGRAALSAPAAPTISRLWQAWLGSTLVDELSRVEAIKGQTGKAKLGLTPPKWRRSAIADALRACPVGAWVSADEVLRFVRASSDFRVSDMPSLLYLCEPNYGSLPDNASGHVDTRYLLAFLLEYAATLGVIDVALVPPAGARGDYGDLWGADELLYLSRYDGLACVRVNALGAYCLGATTGLAIAVVGADAGAPQVRLRVLANLEVEAVGGDVASADALALDTYAVRVTDRRWRIDPGKLLTAVEQGRPAHAIAELLAARSAEPIPNRVWALCDEVTARSAMVHDRGAARLVECAGYELADLIADNARTRNHCMRVGEKLLVVPTASLALFKRGLRDLGYLLRGGEVAPQQD